MPDLPFFSPPFPLANEAVPFVVEDDDADVTTRETGLLFFNREKEEEEAEVRRRRLLLGAASDIVGVIWRSSLLNKKSFDVLPYCICIFLNISADLTDVL